MDVQARADDLAQLIEDKLGIRGHGLAAKLGRGGRTLPRQVRRAGQALLDAQDMGENPRLAPRIDYPRIAAAYERAERVLAGIDPGERRVTFAVNMLARIVAKILLVAALAVAVMAWRGLL